MTRNEWIQQYLLRSWDDTQAVSFRAAVNSADALQESGIAPWDETTAKKNIDEIVAAAVQVEREACAKACESWAGMAAERYKNLENGSFFRSAAMDLANVLRGRGRNEVCLSGKVAR